MSETTEKTETTPKETSTTTYNMDQVADAVDSAHKKLETSFDTGSSNQAGYQTRAEMKKQAEAAKQVITDLNDKVNAAKTPSSGNLATDMKTDTNNEKAAEQKIAQGKDALTTYAKNAVVAIKDQPTDSQNKTYDSYNIDKKGNVSYTLQNVKDGQVAAATGNPNHLSGAVGESKSYTYNEEKKGSDTVVTATYTLNNSRAPSSEHTAIGQTGISSFKNTYTVTATYDKNDRLTAQKQHIYASGAGVTDTYAVADKNKDMSTDGYAAKETIDIRTTEKTTAFDQTKYDKNGNTTYNLTGSINGRTTSVEERNGNNVTYAEKYYDDLSNSYLYRGGTGVVDKDNNMTNQKPTDPHSAEKTYNNLHKKVNQQVQKVTGKESLEAYQNQLGEPKKKLSLGAYFNENSTPESAAQSLQKSEELTAKYQNQDYLTMKIQQAQQGR
jgi:hypothetical protein